MLNRTPAMNPRFFLLAALAACALVQPAWAQDDADTILHGGKVATLRHKEGFVEAIALKGGRVHAVGSDAEIAAFAGKATRMIDLEGRTVIPGLNDSHAHVTRAGRFFNLELRWDGVASLKRGLEMIAEQARRTPKGQWVRVIGGWSPFQFVERRMPTIAELNEAAPDTPVFVLFLYSKGFLNAAAVRALGITEETRPPKGTRYDLRDGGAELLAEPSPTILYGTIGKLPQLRPKAMLNSTLQFYRELSRFGLTSAIDAGGGGHLYPNDYGATEQLAREGRMPLRVSYYLFPQRPGKELADFRNWTNDHEAGRQEDRSKRGGYVLRGGGEFLTWSAGDFENFMAPRPHLKRAMDAELQWVTSLLAKKGWPFRIHATYGESIDRILNVFAKVHAKYPIDKLRWAIDHAETIRPDQIQRIQRLGGGVAIQNRMAFAGEYFLERYGKDAAATAPPLRALVESGVPLGAGTDATRVSSYNPWLSIAWMVTGRTVGNTVLYPPENRLTRLEALRLYTRGSAWFSGEDNVKGILKAGMVADLAVLDADYFSVAETEIRHIESVLTVVDGKITYAAGPYRELGPAPIPAVPAWSPVNHFGGYQRSRAPRSQGSK